MKAYSIADLLKKEEQKSYMRKNIVNFSILYYFMVLLFTIEILCNSVVHIGVRFEQVASLLFLYIFPFFYYLCYKSCNILKEKVYVDNDYYASQFSSVSGLERFNNSFFLHIICTVTIVYIIIFIIIIFVVPAYNDIFRELLNRFYIEKWRKSFNSDIISIALGSYAFLLALIPIIVAYLNNRCTFFEPYEIKIIKISNIILIISIIEMGVYFVLRILKCDIVILAILELIWIALIAVNIFIDICAFFGPLGIEKKVLKKIDCLFWKKKIYMPPNKRWNKSNVIRQLAYLLKEYEKNLYKIKRGSINRIEFGSILSENRRNVEVALKKYKVIVTVVIAILFIYGSSLSFPYNVQQKWIYLLLTLLAGLPLIYPLVNREIVVNNYKLINNTVFIATWGYFMKVTNKKELLYITSYDRVRGKYQKFQKYILSLKRIVCFYNLALKMKYSDTDNIDKVGIDCLCAYVSDKKREDKFRTELLIPIIICACLNEKEKKRNLKKVKGVIAQMELSKEEQAFVVQLSMLVLRDIHGNDIEFWKKDYQNDIDKLLA